MTGADNILGNAGPEFEQDLQSPEYDRYLIFTYGISTELLSWFDEDDSIVVCGPDDTTEAVYNTASGVDASIETRTVQSHAKLYLMWGEERITCWLGSFNFTYSGIYESVEWAARFSESLEYDPTPQELLAGDVPDDLTSSWQIRQAIELIASAFIGSDTEWTDSLLQNTDYPHVLVHSHRSNTLKRALRNELANATGTVSITYYAPFVNARGIELFTETLAPDVRPEDIALTVRTCRLSEITNQDTGLNSSHVGDFERRFADFAYQVRAPGDQGNHLRDGRELRSGFAHQKIVGLQFVDREGQEQRVSLLTTANLTKNAWQHNSGNFEIGLLLRDHTRNEHLHDFLGSQLPYCYERPRERELDEAVSSRSASASFEEVWLEDLVRERLNLRDDALELTWSPSLPPLDAVEATVYYRNLLDGSRSPETVDLEHAEEGRHAGIPSLSAQSNTVIDFIELDIETSFRPPERRLTDPGIERVRSGELSLSEYPGDVVVCDGSAVPVESFDIDTTTATEIWLRAEYPKSRTLTVIHEPRSQPHLDATFVQDVSTGTVTTAATGGLAFLDVTVDAAITPRHDQLLLRRPAGGPVEYLGYATTDAETIRYYFDERNGGDVIDLTIAPPLDRYYRPGDRQVSLPQPDTGTADAVHTFTSSQLTAQPVGDTTVIDDQTAIEFEAELTELSPDEAVEVHWGVRGYDRFGETLPLGETLPPQEPHRRLWFRGAVMLDVDGTEITLLTQRNSVGIKEQPFVSTVQVRDDLLPTHLDLRYLSRRDVFAWLVINRSELLKPAVRDTDRHLEVRVSESGTEYTRVICPVLDDGELLCLPLLGAHQNRRLQYAFEFELQGGQPEISYYAPRQATLDLTINTDESAIELSWADCSHVIRHRDGAETPSLNVLSDRVSAGELSQMLFSDDPFELDEREGLAIRVNEVGLLHLVDG